MPHSGYLTRPVKLTCQGSSMILSGKLVASTEGLRVSRLQVREEWLGFFVSEVLLELNVKVWRPQLPLKTSPEFFRNGWLVLARKTCWFARSVFKLWLKGMWPESLLTVLCNVPILVILFMLVRDDRIDKPFLNNPTGTGLKPAWGLHPWTALWVTYSLLALHFPFVFPEVQPQGSIPAMSGDCTTTRVFRLDPILPCPRLQNLMDICGTGFRLLPQFLKPVFVIIFSAAYLSSAWKSTYILFIPLP